MVAVVVESAPPGATMVVVVDNQVYDTCRKLSKGAMVLSMRASVRWMAGEHCCKDICR